MDNKEKGKSLNDVKEEGTTLEKRKESYEMLGIPVAKLLYCHGLPMTV